MEIRWGNIIPRDKYVYIKEMYMHEGQAKDAFSSEKMSTTLVGNMARPSVEASTSAVKQGRSGGGEKRRRRKGKCLLGIDLRDASLLP